MTHMRQLSTPPTIPGYSAVGNLGSGGFAEVFLFSQDFPQRHVAIKVLRDGEQAAEAAAELVREANILSSLPQHPSIVAIFDAGMTADGRPYLVLEYCPNIGPTATYQLQVITIQEVLQAGIHLASAIETMHRVGVIHRDIKPSNILVSELGRPALTDFGSATLAGTIEQSPTLSIPWSPPEVLIDGIAAAASADIYSLGATLYTFLARQPPFGTQDQGTADLIARINRGGAPRIPYAGIPESLHAALSGSMSRSPADRFTSAKEFAQHLQEIENELGLAQTPIEIAEALPPQLPAPTIGPQTSDHTQHNPIVLVSAAADIGLADTGRFPGIQLASPYSPVPAQPLHSTAGQGSLAYPDLSKHPEPTSEQIKPRSRRRTFLTWTSSIAACVGISLAAVLVWNTQQDTAEVVRPSASADIAKTETVPSPKAISATSTTEDTVVFSWTNPDPQPGDQYLWGIKREAQEPQLELISTPSVTVPIDLAEPTLCIQVLIVRADRRASPMPADACYPEVAP